MTQHDDSSTTGEGAETPGQPNRVLLRPSARRTHRACDRCRVKKSKCNGQQPCATCNGNERTCVFSALRRRDIRKWHCHMQDTVDEAIQRLYRACKTGVCFPGILPDENDGYVTTERILQGMGFTNLDIGPRPTGPQDTGLSYQLPFHQRLITNPLQINTIGAPTLRSDHHVLPVKTDTSSISPTNSVESSHLSDEYHVSPVTHGPYAPQSSSTMVPTLHQSNEHLNVEIPPGYLSHHHHPEQQAFERERLQLQQQRLYHHEHMRDFETRDTSGSVSTPISPHVMQGGYAHPPVPFGFVQQYPSPPYYVYDGGSYISPEQTWSRNQQSA